MVVRMRVRSCASSVDPSSFASRCTSASTWFFTCRNESHSTVKRHLKALKAETTPREVTELQTQAKAADGMKEFEQVQKDITIMEDDLREEGMEDIKKKSILRQRAPRGEQPPGKPRVRHGCTSEGDGQRRSEEKVACEADPTYH